MWSIVDSTTCHYSDIRTWRCD